MIKDYLIPEVKRCFNDMELNIDLDKNPHIRVFNKFKEIGPVEIFDDGYEATINIVGFTHGHFDYFEEDKDKEITVTVVDFLKDLFSDQVILWRSKDGSTGGWVHKDYMKKSDIKKNAEYYIWSGLFDVQQINS